jgi:acyl carrier protein
MARQSAQPERHPIVNNRPTARKAMTSSPSIETTKNGIQLWCQNYLANLLSMPVDKLDPDAEFDDFGLDSAMAVAMVLELEEQLGIEIPPSLLFEHTTIAQLATHLGDVMKKSVGAAA